MKALEEQEQREHGHELRAEIVPEHCKRQTSLRDHVPTTLEQMLQLDRSQLTKEYLIH